MRLDIHLNGGWHTLRRCRASAKSNQRLIMPKRCGRRIYDSRNTVETLYSQPHFGPTRRIDWNRVLENLALRFEENAVEMGAWQQLVDAMRTFADELDRLPQVMEECGVDPPVIARRAEDIRRLRDELRAIRTPE